MKNFNKQNKKFIIFIEYARKKYFLKNYQLPGSNFDQYHRSVDKHHQAHFDPFEWDKMIDIDIMRWIFLL